MRADVERNTATGTDAYGHPVAPVFAAVATIPCWVYSRTRREVANGVKTALVEDLRALFARDADVRERDEIARVADRQGNELLAGRLRIEALQRKPGHIEAVLERVQ
ncbi:MAG: hypothetical protein ACE5GS_15160 [Kiloniellaceae bacterium]